MKRKLPFCFALSGALLLYSCAKPPCECDAADTRYIDVKVVDSQHRNLVFGPARLFEFDSIRVLKNNLDFSVHNAAVNHLPGDTAALRLHFYVTEERSYIYYNQQTKPDTLDVLWQTKTGRCCGGPFTYQTVAGIKLNSGTLQPQGGTYFIVK